MSLYWNIHGVPGSTVTVEVDGHPDWTVKGQIPAGGYVGSWPCVGEMTIMQETPAGEVTTTRFNADVLVSGFPYDVFLPGAQSVAPYPWAVEFYAKRALGANT